MIEEIQDLNGKTIDVSDIEQLTTLPIGYNNEFPLDIDDIHSECYKVDKQTYTKIIQQLIKELRKEIDRERVHIVLGGIPNEPTGVFGVFYIKDDAFKRMKTLEGRVHKNIEFNIEEYEIE